jgi:hypothetical protein
MTRAEIHEEIADLLRLMEINNNRLALNDATAEIDIQQMRTHVLRLYTLLDQYTISDEAALEPVVEEPVIEEPKPDPIITAKKPVRKKRKLKFTPEVIEKPSEPVVEEKPVVEEVEIPEPVIEEPEVLEPVVEEVAPVPEPEPVPEVKPVEKKKKAKKSEKKPKAKNSSPSGGDIYHKLKNTKLESIKKGISISKRYEIQNELFGNDATLYNKSIQTLDSAGSLDEAVDFFENTLMAERHWDEEDALVEELRNLLERRYM